MNTGAGRGSSLRCLHGYRQSFRHRLISYSSSSSALVRRPSSRLFLLESRPYTITSSASLAFWDYVHHQLLVWENQNNDGTRKDKPSQTMLACSSSATVVVRSRWVEFFDRIAHQLREWYQRLWEAWIVTCRSTEIILRLSPLAIGAPIAYLWEQASSDDAETRQNLVMTEWCWSYLLHQIQALGPGFIKLAQWMATRRDLFPPALCQRLAQLQDHGIPHDWSHTYSMLQEALAAESSNNDNNAIHCSYDDDKSSDSPSSSSSSSTPPQLIIRLRDRGQCERRHRKRADGAISDVIGCGSAAQVYQGKWRIKKVKREQRSQTMISMSSAILLPWKWKRQQSVEQGDEPPPEYEYRDVAVKVLHPQFGAMVQRDLRLMTSVANLLHHVVPLEVIRMMNLPRVAENFGRILQPQADLTIEAENLRQFRANFGLTNDDHDRFGRNASGSIFFPKPYFASTNILVEDLIMSSSRSSNGRDNDMDNTTSTTTTTATPMGQYLQANNDATSSPQIRHALAVKLLPAFLKMVFWDNFIHCDLHAGNVIVQTKTTTTTKHHTGNNGKRDEHQEQPTSSSLIVFLDAGIVTSLKKDDQRNLKDLFRAVLLNDGYTAGRLMVERAKWERCSSVPGATDAFARGVEEIVSEFHDSRSKGLTLGAVRIGTLLSRVLDLCRTYGVEIDHAMANVVVSTLVLEGLGRSLDPELNLMDFAIPFVLGRGRV